MKLNIFPHKLTKGEAGLQTAWTLLRRFIPSRFLHVLIGHAIELSRLNFVMTSKGQCITYWQPGLTKEDSPQGNKTLWSFQ